MQDRIRQLLERDDELYYTKYINNVEGDHMVAMKEGLDTVPELLAPLTEEQWNFRYAPTKWTIKQVLLHIIDTERIFSYRALRLARHDKTPMAGFDQDQYMTEVKADLRSPQSILEEFDIVRKSTIIMFENFTDDMLLHMGIASDLPMTTLSIGFIIPGHERHHMRIVRDKYL